MLISRYLLRGCVKRQIKKRAWFKKHYGALDAILVENGAKSVALLRMSYFPLTPSSLILGVTNISTKDFFLGSMSYILKLSMSIYPGCRLYVIGQKDATKTDKWIFGFEVAINISITIILGILAKRAMQKKIEELSQRSENE